MVPYLNESYGSTLSELIMNGRMDLAVLYGGKVAIHGLSFLPLLKEPLFLVGPGSCRRRLKPCPCTPGEMDLYLPRPYNVVRRMVDEAFATIGGSAARGGRDRVAPAPHGRHRRRTGNDHPAGFDGTRDGGLPCGGWQSRIVEPGIEAPLALCQSDHLPLSEPAEAVKEILLELVAAIPGSLLSPSNVASPAAS